MSDVLSTDTRHEGSPVVPATSASASRTLAPSTPSAAHAAVDANNMVKSKLVKFATCEGFLATLRERVDAHFRATGRRRKDNVRMYIKCFTILAWLAASYLLLVFWASAWWQAVPLGVSLGLAMAAVGFNIQHDGSHGAFSRFAWVNKLAALSLELLGGSSYMWKRKHNIVHHTYTNIDGHDSDIDIGAIGRLSPHQPHHWFHRVQHFYLWILYGFITFKWQFYDDFRKLASCKIGENKFSRPTGWELAEFFVGKLAFVTLALVIPIMFHSWLAVIGVFALASFVQGLMLAVVFQLAHVMDEAEFPVPNEDNHRIESAWAIHQVQTTLNFAPRNRLVTWYTGGLNHQIEHHLFPQICHVNYPAISAVVKQTCDDFNVSYVSHRTIRGALASHYRCLRDLSRPTA